MPSFPVLHYLQFARNSCSLSQWSHPTNASSVAPFSCLQSLPASASASVLPMNIQGWFPLGWTALISLLSKGLSRVLSQHRSSKASSFQCSAFFIVQLWHPYMTTGKTINLTRQTFVSKVMFCFSALPCNLPNVPKANTFKYEVPYISHFAPRHTNKQNVVYTQWNIPQH